MENGNLVRFTNITDMTCRYDDFELIGWFLTLKSELNSVSAGNVEMKKALRGAQKQSGESYLL